MTLGLFARGEEPFVTKNTIAEGERSNPAGDGQPVQRGEGGQKTAPRNRVDSSQNGGAAQSLRHTHGRAFLDRAETQGARGFIAKIIYFQKSVKFV